MPLERARTLCAPVAAASSASNASTCGPSGAIQFDSIGVAQQVELGAGEVGWGEKEAGHGCSQLRRTE